MNEIKKSDFSSCSFGRKMFVSFSLLLLVVLKCSALNNQPTCMYMPNQTQFNPCIFNSLGGAQDQVGACAVFASNKQQYALCLCTKSKSVYEW